MSGIYDIAIVGSGFAGSLLAMIARRLGHSVVLLERGTHPRVVIGESSTPLSNLLLEDLATRYDLQAVAPLAKWGSWQRTYPDAACGLKRGFTFYHHVLGRAKPSSPSNGIAQTDQLLVAASPHDSIADTHWYRADFDALLVREACSLGVDYFDEIKLQRLVERGAEVALEGQKHGRDAVFHAKFVVDATGPRGFLHHALALGETTFPGYPATQALYSHFSHVKRLDEARPCREAPPYPVDDAAVHHIFDGGWIWVLKFNNGITSAGVAATDQAAARLGLSDGAPAWSRLLNLMPVLQEQFAEAKAERPFTHVPHLAFRSARVCGGNWVLLPSAAGFVDPLLSTGFPLTLLGISRLAEILEDAWGSPRFHARLKTYAAQTEKELDATARLIASLYANMNDFPVFRSLSLLYFAAASFSETARRLRRPHLVPSFLLHDHPLFGPACLKLFAHSRHPRTEQDSAQLTKEILAAIEPFDVAGLSRPNQRHWYPVDADDLFRSAGKVGATREEIREMLDRCSFLPNRNLS